MLPEPRALRGAWVQKRERALREEPGAVLLAVVEACS